MTMEKGQQEQCWKIHNTWVQWSTLQILNSQWFGRSRSNQSFNFIHLKLQRKSANWPTFTTLLLRVRTHVHTQWLLTLSGASEGRFLISAIKTTHSLPAISSPQLEHALVFVSRLTLKAKPFMQVPVLKIIFKFTVQHPTYLCKPKQTNWCYSFQQ